MKAFQDRDWFAASAALFTVLAVLSVRVCLEAKREIESAQRLDQAGDFREAIDHYRRALRWWFPMSPFEADAVEGLSRIARTREQAGDVPSALLAWRSLLGGISSTRSFVSRTPAEAGRAKAEISRLLSQGKASEELRKAPTEAGGQRGGELGTTPPMAPNPIWGALLLFGFALWLASLVALIRRGFDEAGRPHWLAARAPLFAALAGFCSFVLGLFFA